MLEDLGMTTGPSSINASQDWVLTEEDYTLSGSVGGSPFAVGVPDTGRTFSQSGPRAYVYPRLSPEGELFAVAGDLASEGGLMVPAGDHRQVRARPTGSGDGRGHDHLSLQAGRQPGDDAGLGAVLRLHEGRCHGPARGR